MSEPSKLNVEIYGHIYTLRVTPEEKAQVEAITAHVDQMMHKVGDDQTRLDYRDVAVLAAIILRKNILSCSGSIRNCCQLWMKKNKLCYTFCPVLTRVSEGLMVYYGI